MNLKNACFKICLPIYFDIENNFSFTLTGIRERVEIFEWSYKGCRKWAR